jgi:hypothetical protein
MSEESTNNTNGWDDSPRSGVSNGEGPSELINKKKVITVSGKRAGFKDGGTSFEVHSIRVVDQDGAVTEIEEFELIVDATGKVLNPPVFTLDNGQAIYPEIHSLSWTNKLTPVGCNGICQMCWEERGVLTRVYIGLDGAMTELGNCLCSRCIPINEKRKIRYSLTFGFWPQWIY